MTAIVHGIQTSWFMAAQEPHTDQGPVRIEEALSVMRMFLYPETHGKIH